MEGMVPRNMKKMKCIQVHQNIQLERNWNRENDYCELIGYLIPVLNWWLYSTIELGKQCNSSN